MYSMLLFLKRKYFGGYQEETLGEDGCVTDLAAWRPQFFPTVTSHWYMTLNTPHTLLGLIWQSICTIKGLRSDLPKVPQETSNFQILRKHPFS